ncbi:MAG: 3'-5' exonuclease [Ignavibacteriales bacterium]|nr:3'-5' exonuclease [Ignavibacteriota bacterium]MCB9249663.1 3'-5' exonuclease [Ignavibacteriales bacterium]
MKSNLRIPISEAKFVVLDVESNGLDPQKDKILSIGAVTFSDNQIDVSNSFELFLEQSEFSSEAVLIHGILKNGNLEKISEQEAMKKLVRYIDNKIIVGHSITFDIAIINETLKKYVDDKLQNKYLDTVNLYKRLKGGDYKDSNPTSLDILSDEFNIPKSDRHNAAGDAMITAILFLKIVSRLKQRGVNTLEDLFKVKRTLI